MSLLSVHALQPFSESNDIYIYSIMQIEGMSLIRENRFNTVRFVASLYVYFIELKIRVINFRMSVVSHYNWYKRTFSFQSGPIWQILNKRTILQLYQQVH